MVAAERGPNSITGTVFGIAAGPVTGGKATDPGSDGCAGDAGSCSSEFVPASDWPGLLVPLPGPPTHQHGGADPRQGEQDQ